MREEDDQLYIYKLYGISVPRKIQVTNVLRQKIGVGVKITQEQIEQAQELIDNPRVDFEPYALDAIRKIENAIYAAADESYMREEDYDKITMPLTEIKGQAAMFGNKLASQLSAILLKYLEHYRRLDRDMLKIIALYCRSIRISYGSRWFEIDNQASQALLSEMQAAMNRYDKKFKQMTGR